MPGKDCGMRLEDLPITPVQVAEVIALVDAKIINNQIAKRVIDLVLAGEGEPREIVEARGLAMVSDDSILQTEVDKALAADPQIAQKIRAGAVQGAGKVIGEVMRATRGRADAARVRELVLAACQLDSP